MKSLLTIIAGLAISINAVAAFKSDIGFTAPLSNDWLVVNKQTASKSKKSKTLASMIKLGISKEKAEKIINQVGIRNVEFLFSRKYASKDFKTNINIQKNTGHAVRTEANAKKYCKQAKPQLNKLFKKEIKLHNCGLKKISHTPFIAYEYSGVFKDVVTIQYEFQLTPNLSALIVGGGKLQNLKELRATQLKLASSLVKFIETGPDYFKELKEGVAAYKKKNYKTALKHIRVLAKAGDPDGLFNLAVFYEKGLGVKQNYKQAIKNYQLAASLGQQFAMTNLASYYMKGIGVKKNPTLAARLYAEAGVRGVALAQYHFASMLFTGTGVKKSPNEAIKWYVQAARQGFTPAANTLIKIYMAEIKAGNAKAQHPLAMIYLQGAGGIKQDTKKALGLLEKSAFSGYKPSREALIEIYSKGLFGIRKNPEKVKFWKDQS